MMLRFLSILPLLLLPAFYPIGYFTNEKYEFDAVEGPYETNMDLNDGEIQLSAMLAGPEAFATRENDSAIYTGLAGGAIVAIDPSTWAVRLVVKSEDPGCAGIWDKRCGRPLGIRFNPTSYSELVVADANRGLVSVNVDTGEVKVILRSTVEILGAPLMLANDVDVDDEGNIYLSQSTSDVPLDFGMFTGLAGGCGRLLRIDAKTGEVKVLVTGLHFANGVQLSQDQSFVLVADGFKGRIMRYYLKGSKKDTTDVFVGRIPGALDNIRASGRKQGGFLVAVPFVWDKDNMNILAVLGDYPLVRAVVARYLWFIRLPFDWITDVYPNSFTGMIKQTIGGFGIANKLSKAPHSMILELDESGKVLRSMHAYKTGYVRISCAFPYEGRLFLGSYAHDGLMTVPWK